MQVILPKAREAAAGSFFTFSPIVDVIFAQKMFNEPSDDNIKYARVTHSAKSRTSTKDCAAITRSCH